ncbi:MAG: hypothetical protein M1815_005710 [Lichina confinis]|nr:MAG: hypothetical protein M1815_005710 [Lichina confinis]
MTPRNFAFTDLEATVDAPGTHYDDSCRCWKPAEVENGDVEPDGRAVGPTTRPRSSSATAERRCPRPTTVGVDSPRLGPRARGYRWRQQARRHCQQRQGFGSWFTVSEADATGPDDNARRTGRSGYGDDVLTPNVGGRLRLATER